MGYVVLFAWILGLSLHGARSWAAWTVVSTLLWSVSCFKQWNLNGEKCGIWWIWGVWLLISGMASIEPWTSSWELLHKWTYILFFTLAVNTFNERHRRHWLLSLWILGAFCGGYALYHWTTAVPIPIWLKPNPHYTGCLMAAVLASIVAVIIHPRFKIQGWQMAGLLALAIMAIVTLGYLGSRGAIVGVMAVSAALIMWRGGFRAAIGLLGAAILGVLLIPPAWIDYVSKVGYEANSYRTLIWNVGLAIAHDFPILGIGPGCYGRGYFLHNFPAFNGLSYYGHFSENAHSELIQLAADSGWPAVILFAWAFARTLRLTLKKAAMDSNPVRMAAAAAASTVFIHSILDGILFLPGLQLLFFSALACGVSDRGQAESAGSPWTRRFSATGLALCLAISGACIFLNIGRKFYAENRFVIDGMKKHNLLIPEKFTDMVSQAEQEELRFAPADFTLYVEAARGAVMQRPSNSARSLVYLNRALELNPTNAVTWLLKAELSRMTGDWRGQERCAWHAVGLEPNFVMGHVVLGEALYHEGRQKQAREALARAGTLHNGKKLPKPVSDYEEFLVMFDENRFLSLQKKIFPGS